MRRLLQAVRELRPWDRLVLAACLAVLAFCFLQLLLFSYGRDQSIYALVAREMLDHSAVPYRDVWDFKPPGIFFVYALARGLFGASMLAPRLLEALGLLAMTLGFLHLAHKLLGHWLAGLFAAAIAAFMHVQLEFWHTGQPESFGGFAVVVALALLVTDFERPRSQALADACVGALFGFAFLLKPPLAGGALVAVAYLLRRGSVFRESKRQTWLPVLRLGLGVLGVLLACGAWFVLRGGWSALYWTLFEFTPGYTRIGWEGRNAIESLYYAIREATLKFSFFIPAGLIALAIGKPVHSREREAIFLFAGTALVQLCGIAMQAKFFPYHYGSTLLLLAWLAGLGFYKLWLRARRNALSVLVFLALVVWVGGERYGVWDVPGTFWERSAMRTQFAFGRGEIESREELDRQLYYCADFNLDADLAAGRAIAELTRGDARVFVWGFEPAIYLFAQREISSKYIYNVPQRTNWGQERARGELMQALEQQPDVIVVQHNDVFPAVTGDVLDSAHSLQRFPELEALIAQNYQAVASVEDFDLYVPSALRYAQAAPLD